MTTRWRVLTISAEPNRQVVETAMANWSLERRGCATVQEARAALHAGRYPVVLCEDKLPDGSYHDIIKLLGSKLDQTRVIVMTATDLDECWSEAQTQGAFDVIASPCRRTDVQWIVIRAIQDQQHRNAFRPKAKPVETANVDTSVPS